MSQGTTRSLTVSEAESKPSSESQGDIRRGGWILVLIGVVLVLTAVALLILL